jgi:hypothetical protein
MRGAPHEENDEEINTPFIILIIAFIIERGSAGVM